MIQRHNILAPGYAPKRLATLKALVGYFGRTVVMRHFTGIVSYQPTPLDQLVTADQMIAEANRLRYIVENSDEGAMVAVAGSVRPLPLARVAAMDLEALRDECVSRQWALEDRVSLRAARLPAVTPSAPPPVPPAISGRVSCRPRGGK